MKRIDLPIIGPAYADDSKTIANQDSINYYPEAVEVDGGRVVKSLKGAPGLSSFTTGLNSASRGAKVMNGVHYRVSGTLLYSVDAAGTATSLGTVPGSDPVGMAENGVQLVVVNGTDGYVYNRNTAIFAQITDTDFLGADTCAFIDQYIVFNDPDTEDFFWCALEDVTSFDGLDIQSTESRTDKLIAVAVFQRRVVALGAKSIEVYESTGSESTFERVPGVEIEVGCGAKHSVAQLSTGIYWLGSDGRFYGATGYQAEPISTRAIEQQLSDETLAECRASAYEDQGHKFIVWTFPNGKTYVYDASVGDPRIAWHHRTSYGYDNWRAVDYVYANGKHLVGDSVAGNIFEMSRDVFEDNSGPLISERYGQYYHQNGLAIRIVDVELLFDTGNGLTTGQGSDPQCELRYSFDYGRTWTDWEQGSLGTTGQSDTRVRFTGPGTVRQCMFHVRVSDPIKRDFLGAYAYVEAGAN